MYKRPDEVDDIELVEDNTNDNTEQLSQEEQTWRKRYGDLRRLLSQKEKTYQDQINDIKIRLQNSSALSLPDENNDAAIDQWVNEHPQIARIVMGLADRRASAATQDLTSRVEELNKRETTLNKETAYRKLDEAHPDFFSTIRHDPAFHDWLSGKAQRIQDAIYGDDNDWRSAIDVVTLYKSENDIKRTSKTPPQKQREAAEYIPNKPTTQPSGDRRVKWKESDIQRMSAAEYEKYEDAIAEASRNGEILMDLSGGAR